MCLFELVYSDSVLIPRISWRKGKNLYDIFQAAGRGDVLLIRRLLAEGADVNARKEGNGEYYSYTPLHIAVFKGHMKASIT